MRADVVRELINGKIYSQACKNIYQQKVIKCESVQDVLDYLSKNSIQVTDENDDQVTPFLIQQDSPFYVVNIFSFFNPYFFCLHSICNTQSAHISLIDSLMYAYGLRVMRLENVITSVK